MAVINFLLPSLTSHPIISSFGTITILFLFRSIYRIYLHPLSHVPGPLLAKITSLWLYYHSYIGDEATVIHSLHAKYGDLVRVSPTEVDIRDVDAVTSIYITKGGFLKAPCYGNFDIDGHKTIFSTIDPEYRAPRAKAVVPMFSTRNIRDNDVALYGCVDRMVERMREESETGKPVNVLNIARSLAVDAVSTHLFQQNYNGTSEKGHRLSASAFVDAFVAVGRFFYLPGPVFVWLDWGIEKFFGTEHTAQSMNAVDKFVDDLVSSTPKGSDNYPGRLMALGLVKSELKCQCKDLIFAGTDSTGMNLATICHQLALNPEK